MVCWTLEEVRDGSGDPRGGSGRVGGPSWRFGTVRRTLGRSETGLVTLQKFGTVRWTILEVRDEPGDPRGGPGRFVGPSGKSGTLRWTLTEVRDGSLDPQGSLGRFDGPSRRSGTVRWTLREVWDGQGTHEKVLDESVDSR